MDSYMKVGFCRNCGKAVKLLPAEGKMQNDWDRQATEKCNNCMQIKVHGNRKTVQGFKQLDLRDLGI